MKSSQSKPWHETVPLYYAEVYCSVCFRLVTGMLYEGINYYGATATPDVFRLDGKYICKACEYWSEMKRRFDVADAGRKSRTVTANEPHAGKLLAKTPANAVAKELEGKREEPVPFGEPLKSPPSRTVKAVEGLL